MIKPKLLFKPKPKQLQQAKRMTIAAGMLCKGGVVFGADTEESIGDLRGRVHKVPMIFEPPAMITGACNHGHLMDTAIERIFDRLKAGKLTTSESIATMLDEVMVGLYRREFRAYPDQTHTPMHLLVAVKPAAESKVAAWSVNCSVVRRMRNLEIVGMGHLVQFVGDHLYADGMSLDNGIVAMCQIVAMGKKMVQSVGGENYVHILRDDGAFGGKNFYFNREAENLYDQFMVYGRQLLLATGTERITEEQFDKIATDFVRNLKWYREQACGPFRPSLQPSNPQTSEGQQ